MSTPLAFTRGEGAESFSGQGLVFMQDVVKPDIGMHPIIILLGNCRICASLAACLSRISYRPVPIACEGRARAQAPLEPKHPCEQPRARRNQTCLSETLRSSKFRSNDIKRQSTSTMMRFLEAQAIGQPKHYFSARDAHFVHMG